MNIREKQVIESLQALFGGVGKISEDKNDNTIRLVVGSKEDLKGIAKFFTHEARLRTKKAR